MSPPARLRSTEEEQARSRVAAALPGLLLAYALVAVLVPRDGVAGSGLLEGAGLAAAFCAVLLLLLRERPRALVVVLALAIALAGDVGDALRFLYPVAAGLLACRLFGEGRGDAVSRYRALQLAVAIAPLGLLALAPGSLLPLLCVATTLLVALHALAHGRRGWALLVVLVFAASLLAFSLLHGIALTSHLAAQPALLAERVAALPSPTDPWRAYALAVLVLAGLAAWLEPLRVRALLLLVSLAALLLAAGSGHALPAASFLLLAGALLAARSRPRAGLLLLAPAIVGAWLLAAPQQELSASVLGRRLETVAGAPWRELALRTDEPLDREGLRRIEIAAVPPSRAALALPLPQAAASARR